MKRNYMPVIFQISIMSFLSYSCWGGQLIAANEKSPDAVVQQFYKNYLSALSDPDVQSGLDHSQNAIDTSTTRHLKKLNSENDSGSDYFTHVQEVCPDWASNIKTKVLSSQNDVATVELILGKGGSESKYHVSLVNENDQWLMDSVKFEGSKTEHCNENK